MASAPGRSLASSFSRAAASCGMTPPAEGATGSPAAAGAGFFSLERSKNPMAPANHLAGGWRTEILFDEEAHSYPRKLLCRKILVVDRKVPKRKETFHAH